MRSSRWLWTLRIYFSLQLCHLRAQLEYGADFWLGIIGTFLAQAAGVVFVWSVFGGQQQLAGWRIWEVGFLYGLFAIARGLVELLCDGAWALPSLVNQGAFDRCLVRPLSPALQVLAQRSSLHGLGNLGLGVFLLVASSDRLAVTWTLGRVLFLALSIANGTAVIGAVNLITNCIAFWEPATRTSVPVLALQIGELAKYPAPLLGERIQRLLTWALPFAFVSYFPSLVLLDKIEGPRLLGWLSPVAGAACCLVAVLVWRRALRRYEGTGH
jgi:ABC-2 type transport system permease protein